MTTSQKAGKAPQPTAAEVRKGKLAEQLRVNLLKRKAQTRARRAGEADERADGLAAKKGQRDG